MTAAYLNFTTTASPAWGADFSGVASKRKPAGFSFEHNITWMVRRFGISPHRSGRANGAT
jgi:hypothetical protein